MIGALFKHDLGFYEKKTAALAKVVDELQIINPTRKYLAIKTRIDCIDALLKLMAKPFNNCGRAMGKTHFMNTIKPIISMREWLVCQYDLCKPKEYWPVGGFSGGPGNGYSRMPFDESGHMPNETCLKNVQERSKFVNEIFKGKQTIVMSNGKGTWDLLNELKNTTYVRK